MSISDSMYIVVQCGTNPNMTYHSVTTPALFAVAGDTLPHIMTCPHIKRSLSEGACLALYIPQPDHDGGACIQKIVVVMSAYLGTAKASVGSVAGNVGAAAEALHTHIGDFVGCINVQQCPIHDGCTQVQAVGLAVTQLAPCLVGKLCGVSTGGLGFKTHQW